MSWSSRLAPTLGSSRESHFSTRSRSDFGSWTEGRESCAVADFPLGLQDLSGELRESRNAGFGLRNFRRAGSGTFA